MRTENENMQSSRNGGTVLAVVFRYVVVQSFLPLIDAKLLKLKQQLDEYFSE